jgi:hypothetical protein
MINKWQPPNSNSDGARARGLLGDGHHHRSCTTHAHCCGASSVPFLRPAFQSPTRKSALDTATETRGSSLHVHPLDGHWSLPYAPSCMRAWRAISADDPLASWHCAAMVREVRSLKPPRRACSYWSYCTAPAPVGATARLQLQWVRVPTGATTRLQQLRSSTFEPYNPHSSHAVFPLANDLLCLHDHCMAPDRCFHPTDHGGHRDSAPSEGCPWAGHQGSPRQYLRGKA